MGTVNPLARILSGRPINTSSGSETCYDLINYWIDKCRNEHRSCHQIEEFALPNRVVDVGSTSRSPFLHITGGQKGQWATLSHCWGSDLLITTTQSTIKQRQTCIPLMDLQPTFQDAILIVRRLGIQYLWIDALCIIQDSSEDWARESARMHEIYSRASINIAATAGRSSRDGIFRSADKDRCHTKPLVKISSFSSSLKIEGSLAIRMQTGHYPMVWVVNQPLHKRAWVLQESTLSPRRIDFSSEQIYWSCRESTFTEGDPHISQTQDSGMNGKNLFKMPLGRIPPQPYIGTPADISPMSWWYSTLFLYSRRSLTIPNDSLPAIAGVAREVKKRTGYTYIAGLWQEDLHRALLWQSDLSVKRLEKSSVPSWSWASTQFPWPPRLLFLHIYLPGFRATLLEANIDTMQDKPFGSVISGSLKLEGGCKVLEYWKIGANIVYNTSPRSMRLLNKHIHPKTSRHIGYKFPPPGCVLCTLDENIPEGEGEQKFEAEIHSGLIQRKAICLQIAKFGHGALPHFIKTDEEIATVFGLILEPTGDGEDEYKRIGIIEIPEENGLAEGWDRRVVTIV